MIDNALKYIEAFAPDIPRNVQYIQGAIAAGLVVLALTAGWYLSKYIGPKLRHLWEARAGYESELAGRRIRDMTRRATTFILCGIFLAAYPWYLIAQVVFSLTIAITVGLFANDLIRGVRMPNWLGTTIGLALFVSIGSGLVGGIEPITLAMDKVGFSLGSRRISLLWIVTLAMTAVILLAVARVLMKLVAYIISNSELDAAQKVLGQKLATVSILAGAFVLGLDVVGIDLTALAVFSGAFGLAIGFGMQKTIGNLIAGIILLMDRSIKPGDVIAVGNTYGWVNKIGVRAVSVLTRAGKEHLIPNEDLMTREVENWSYSSPNVRISIPVGVSYNTDMDQAIELMKQACVDVPRVLNHPKPVVWMLEFGDNSVNFEIRCWIKDPQSGVGNFRAAILKRVWDLFKEHGVEIPFPQRDLHIKSLPEGGTVILQAGSEPAIGPAGPNGSD
ncbi:mechanosensitive ion channel family protein [Sphingorhabdus sp. 109]|jgi:small-conductance mechanosensitive channel|uniref:mechanosensitive ion channel family protein n=1 Tax=Sphingorhabdus sp. 109 TaxID=2653173 RepID=UPI0012F0A92D|nr:mechanosensitive ion channel domain-containing protein [Sphingorhabdus sp. 109]VWX61629.1 Mechanosensitive ion channel protein MscS [Sphingorhabdus sp. 109]